MHLNLNIWFEYDPHYMLQFAIWMEKYETWNEQNQIGLLFNHTRQL